MLVLEVVADEAENSRPRWTVLSSLIEGQTLHLGRDSFRGVSDRPNAVSREQVQLTLADGVVIAELHGRAACGEGAVRPSASAEPSGWCCPSSLMTLFDK